MRWTSVMLAAMLAASTPVMASTRDAAPSRQSVDPSGVAFEVAASGHIIVPARINGHPVHLVIDTGAGATVIDRNAAEALDMRPSAGDGGSAIGAGGKNLAIQRSGGNTLRLAGTENDDLDLRIMDLAHVVEALSTPGRAIAGVIGFDWLDRHGVVIDYATRTLHVMR